MNASRRSLALASLLVLALAAPSALAVSGDDPPTRIPVSAAPGTPQLLAPWDPDSPQRLVQIQGDLYQEDGAFYYRVVEDSVTIRLASGVQDWNELLQLAIADSPRTFGILRELRHVRKNRLGIVDLALPDGTPPFWCELLHRTGLVEFAEVSTYGAYTVQPNDPQYSQQWALNNTGQTGGTAGADVDAERAWDISAGSSAVIVAILDSGTEVDHEDLNGNVWINEDENPTNGVDDDNNGFIDDWRGWDFPNNNNDPSGVFFHGTHVAGIVNAVTDNGVGIAGLAGGIGGTPGVRGMAIGVGDNAPQGAILDDAIIYAADNGAQVITLSLSVGSSSAIQNALDYAYNTKDVFIDCAAGNNGPSVSFPANQPEVMAVASTTDVDLRSSFSNTGPEVEIAAPGSNIQSTQLNNGYGSSSGTSFAAPYVGALAGLIRSVGTDLTAPQVRQLIIDTAEDVESPGFDNETGWGRINAYEAMLQTGSPDGTIEFDAELYSCSDQLGLTTKDVNLGGQGQVVVTLRSDVEPSGEAVTLTETTFATFTGTVATAPGGAAPDGVLQATHGDTLIAEYVDADDGQGGVNVIKVDTATTDCAGPQITAVSASNVDDQSASISWTTDEAGTSTVRYGSGGSPDQETDSALPVTAHTLGLTGLDSCTGYVFEVESADGFDNATIDDNGGTFYEFETLGDFPGFGVVPCRTGSPLLDRSAYGCNSAVQVSLVDIDLNVDPRSADGVEVLMSSTSEPSGEWITLTELEVDGGLFGGSIQLNDQAPTADGALSVAADDLITVTYFDEDDGAGQPQVTTYVSGADCTGPAIRDIRVTTISSTRAEIEWITDEPATSRVEFGPDAGLGFVAEDTERTTTHGVAVSAFDACDRIFFNVSGTDEFGASDSADAAGQPFEFNLNQIGGLVFHDNFETDTGWSLAGDWQRTTPLGLGSSSGDPDAAYSGSASIGNDITGGGAVLGDYEAYATISAISPSFSTIGASNLELILKRKLGMASDDTAGITLMNGTTETVWASSGTVDDADWVEQRIGIAGADNLASVQVAFGIHAGPSIQSYGWNIDEVIVKDATQPDYLTCGGCAGAPSFAGLTAAFDADACVASDVTLEWDAATAWGTGSGGTYDVHRGTTSEFVPDALNLVVSGLTTTSWSDPAAPPDTPVWYVVRARNNESCAGGEGLADANVTRLPAIETAGLSQPADVGASLRGGVIGLAHVQLGWDPAADADRYIVRRSDSPDFSSVEEIGTTPDTQLTDVDAATSPNLYFYRVFSANACGEQVP